MDIALLLVVNCKFDIIIRIRERQMLKVTKCIGVKSFVEALINMVCELKITSGCKKMCKKFMVIRHSITSDGITT